MDATTVSRCLSTTKTTGRRAKQRNHRDAWGATLWLVVGLCAIGGAWRSAAAQEMEVPVATQVSLLARVLAFDRSLRERIGDELVIGIVYQRRFRTSLNAMEAVDDALSLDVRFEGISVKWVAIDVTDISRLSAAIAEHGVDLLYVAPLRALEIDVITAVSREHRILTYTGVPEYVAAGIVIGIGERRGRPSILINVTASKIVGAEFSSELLKLARIVDTP